MTAHTANAKFAQTVKSERKITNQILQMIIDIEDKKFHLALGYSSLFDWLTKGHGYDEGSANRRIQASRAMRAVPEVAEKLQEGKTTMTNLVKAQAIFRHHKTMTNEEKREVIETIEGQTTEQATRTLFEMFPDAASKINQDRKTILDDKHVRHSQSFTNEEDLLFERVKELLSHKMPNATMAEVKVYLAKYFIEREDPLVKVIRVRKSKKTDSASKQRVTKAKREQVIKKAQGQCEYVDEMTGKRCESRVRPEADHIRMRAHGGSNESENLRCLCRAHNQFMSEQNLGKERANRWRTTREKTH